MGYYKNIQNNGPASAGSETEAHFMKQNRTRMALADAYLRLLNDYTIDRITVKMITDAAARRSIIISRMCTCSRSMYLSCACSTS